MARPREGFGRVRKHAKSGYYIDVRPHGQIWGLSGVGFGQNAEVAAGLLTMIRVAIATQGLSDEEAVSPYLSRRAPIHRIARRYEQWLEEQRKRAEIGDLSPRTVQEYKRYARKGGELAWWGERAVFDVTTGDLEAWSVWMAHERGLSPKTRRHVLAALRACFRWLRRKRMVREVPDWPGVAVPDHSPKILTVEAQARVLAAIPAEERGAHLVAALMALRPSEVRALMPADFTAPEGNAPGELAVTKACQGQGPDCKIGPTKTRRHRTLPCPSLVSEWIAEHVPADARIEGRTLFVNPRTEKRWSHWALRQSWLRGCKAAGLAPVPLYDGTKHSGATAMYDRTKDMEAVRAYLGHQDARSTRLYAKIQPGALVEIASGRERRSGANSVGILRVGPDRTSSDGETT